MPRVILGVIAAAAYVGWHVASLTRAPVPYFDDTFFASIGHTFARTGELRLAVAPLWMRDPVYLYGPVYFIAERAVFATFGFGIFQSRVLALVGGLAMIGLAFAVLRAADVRRTTALAACALLALDPTLNVSVHGGRMDTMALAFVLASLLLLLRASAAAEPRLAVLVVSGVFAALAVLTTPRSAFLVIVLVALLIARSATARTRGRVLLAWALPIAGLYAMWVAYAFGGVVSLLAYYRQFGGQYVGARVFVRPIHVPLLTALATALALRFVRGTTSRRSDGLAALAVGGIVAFYALGIDPPRFGTAYSVFMTPLAYLALAALVSGRDGWAGAALMVVLLVCNGGVFAARATVELSQWRSRDPAPVDAFVRAHVPPGSRVIGDDKFYYAVLRAGSDFQYWERGGSVEERAVHQVGDYGFTHLVTGADRDSELFRAYAARAALVPVAAITPAEPTVVTRWLLAVAHELGLGAPLVADYHATLFVRADRDRGMH